MTMWYISFAGNEGFRGATIVEGATAEDAFMEVNRRGLNPGGEAAILIVPKEAENEPDALVMRNRLVRREEMLFIGAKPYVDCPPEIQQRFDDEMTTVCADCNASKK